MDDEEKISYCNGLLDDAKQSREPRDLEWYLNHMFKEGNHYLTYNTTTNAIESNPPRNRGEVRMVVNKIRSSTRAIQNYVTSGRPKWEVVPGDLDESTVRNARLSGKVLDYIYRKLHLESLISGAVEDALDKSIAWVELDWDPNADGGSGQVRLRLQDPFDVWLDKSSYLYGGKVVGRFIAKTVTKSLDEIKNDDRYDEKARKKVKEDDEIATSSMKSKIIRKERGNSDDVIKRAIVKEFMLWDDEGNDENGNIQLFTYSGNQVLIDEGLENDHFPIYPLQVSMNPLKVYQRSWTADAIPLNKALDRAISQKIMYVNQALVYRIIAEKGHGVNRITNEQGEIIEINKNREFKQMDMHPLPYGFDSLATEINTYIEDIMGAHDAALGRLPSGARSGKTLEALQAADANNLTGVTQSLESFLSVIGKEILDMVADKYVHSRVVKIAEPEDGEEFVKVAGKNAPKTEDTTIITEDNEVIVKIGSWLGHTKEAQRETLLELAQLGVLPAEEVLRQFEFPNVEELSARAREQRLEQHQLDAEVAGREQGMEQGAPQEEGMGPGGIDMIALADKENMAMMNGEQLPPTEGATPEHTQAHVDFVSSNTFQSEADEQIAQIFAQHIQGESQMGGGAPQGGMMP